MQLIKSYARGTKLFKVHKTYGTHKTVAIPWDVHIYYDAPRRMPTFGAAVGSPLSMMLQANIAGHTASLLMDSGASECFISEGICQRVGLKYIVCVPTQVRMANIGTPVTTTCKCEVGCIIQLVKFVATCYIVPLPKEFDMILGDRWSLRNGLMLDWVHGTCTVHRGKRKHMLRCNVPASPYAHVRNESVALILPRKDGDEELSPEIAQLIDEYADGFPDDRPSRLPPKRNIGL